MTSAESDIDRGSTRRLLADERGAIAVIATFMAAFLVGAMYYTVGLGEAMLYRQQMRAVADSAAFDAAVMYALGMNMLSMLNIVMAAVMSIVVLFTMILLIGLIVTIVCCIPPLWEGLPACLSFDADMYDATMSIRWPVYLAVTVLNGTEGAVAIGMPWAGWQTSKGAADAYRSTASSTTFSLDMIPTRLPYVSSLAEHWLNNFGKDKPAAGGDSSPTEPASDTSGSDPQPNKGFMDRLKKGLPIAKKGFEGWAQNTKFLPRYGLPVQDSDYKELCGKAGSELVEEAVIFGTFGSTLVFPIPKFAQRAEDVVAKATGWVTKNFAWFFCAQDIDPVSIVAKSLESFADILGDVLKNQLHLPGPLSKLPGGIIGIIPDRVKNGVASSIGKWFIDKVAGEAKKKGFDFKKYLSGLQSKVETTAKDAKEAKKSMDMFFVLAPMKPFEGYENGNVYGQIWSSVQGSPSRFLLPETGVRVAGSPSSTPPPPAGIDHDFSEAEFYYQAKDWSGAKDEAMWNLRWKARLRRYQPANWDLGKEVSSFLWGFSGAEKGLEKIVDALFVRGKNALGNKGKKGGDDQKTEPAAGSDPAGATDGSAKPEDKSKDYDKAAGKTYKTFLSDIVNNCFKNVSANNGNRCAVFPFGLVKDPPGQDRNGYKYDDILH